MGKACKRILILTRWGIGDVLRTTPLIRLLGLGMPACEIDVAVRNSIAQQVLFGNPYVRDPHVMPKTRKALARYILSRRKQRYDAVIACYPAGLVTVLIGFLIAGRKVYSHLAPGGAGWLQRLLCARVIRPSDVPHHIDKNLALAGLLGADTAGASRAMEVFLTDEDHQAARAFVEENGLAGRVLVGLSPGCGIGYKEKRWPAEHYAELSDLVHERIPGAAVLVFEGDWMDKEAVDAMGQSVQRPFVRLRGLPLREAMAIKSLCAVVVCNDNGGMHMAEAVGTPVVAIFGPTDAAEFGPTGTHDVLLQRADLGCCPCWDEQKRRIDCTNPVHLECLVSISPEEVLAEVNAVMGDNRQ